MQAAEKFENDWEYDEFDRSQTEKIISIKKERIKREQVKRARRSKLKMHTCTLFVVLSFALVIGHVIYQNSIVNEAKYEIFNLKSEIKSLTAKTEELQVKIESQTDLDTIKAVAIEKLGMQYPTQDQIVYIDEKFQYTANVPEPVVVAAVSEETAPKGFVGYVGAFVSGLFE